MKRIIKEGEPEYKVVPYNKPRALKVSQLIDYLKQLDQDAPINLLYDDRPVELHIYEEGGKYYIPAPLELWYDENWDTVVKNEYKSSL